MNSLKNTAGMISEHKAQPIKHYPFVSLVAPVFNEEKIIEKNLDTLCKYMSSLEHRYRWELIVVNDGSTDRTGNIADGFAKSHNNVRVLHHMYNFRLGQALRYAFNNCKGDYVVTLDIDLSYAPDHIDKMLAEIERTRAKIVIASPYMKGGKVSNVPLLRRILSKLANRFLSILIKTPFDKITTLTGMVRAYDQRFLSGLVLKAMDVDIHCEIIYKAMILRARIVEIPAHLKWNLNRVDGGGRKSSMRIIRGIFLNVVSGFILRPFMFFIIPGFTFFFVSLYPLSWAIIHTITQYRKLLSSSFTIAYPLSESIAAAFLLSPQSFIVGSFSLIISLQFIFLGILSFQNKRNFEELFNLSSNIYKNF